MTSSRSMFPTVESTLGSSAGTAGESDVIEFKIHGQEMQFVEMLLDPGESAIAEAGAMMYKDATIEMTTIFGDGSHQEGDGTVPEGLADDRGAGQRLTKGRAQPIEPRLHDALDRRR